MDDSRCRPCNEWKTCCVAFARPHTHTHTRADTHSCTRKHQHTEPVCSPSKRFLNAKVYSKCVSHLFFQRLTHLTCVPFEIVFFYYIPLTHTCINRKTHMWAIFVDEKDVQQGKYIFFRLCGPAFKPDKWTSLSLVEVVGWRRMWLTGDSLFVSMSPYWGILRAKLVHMTAFSMTWMLAYMVVLVGRAAMSQTLIFLSGNLPNPTIPTFVRSI